MKRLLLLIALVPVIGIAQSRKERKTKERADKITYENLQAHIKYLADDKLEGRRTGSEGEMLAMQYIEDNFKKTGLEPKGTNGYVQEFEINEGKKFSADNNSFMVNGNRLELKKDYFPLPWSANSIIKGTASLALRENAEPWFYDVKDLLDENRNNAHFDINEVLIKEARMATEKGAVALVIYNSSGLVDNIQFNKNDTAAALDIPVVFLTGEGKKNFFSDATDTYDLNISVSLTHAVRKARNIIGTINYNAPITIIIGAHYDHLGYGEDGNSLDGQGKIHNGADDNASGTAALIEIARILKQSKEHNNNYIFIAFSGEELGLFGSKYWLEHPTVNTTPNYMINLDMVGRLDSASRLSIGGYGTSPTWSEVLSKTNTDKLNIKFDSSGSGPSDHASFYRKDIPVLFFFTNNHSDYHKATDDWDKINYKGEVAIVNFVQRIVEATDDKGKLAFLKTRDAEARSVSLPVTLGVVPDYGFTGTGMRIEGVSKGKTAEKAGLQAGDVLLQLGDYKFVDVMSYMQALQHFKKGDITVLKIKRAEKEMEFNVQF